MGNGLVESFVGALQAAISVLLTMSYGIIAGQFEMLDLHSTRQVAKLCVNVLLPALFITKVGAQLETGNIARYAVIMVWSFTYTVSSLALAVGLKRALKMPSWTTVATMFNNTTSLPLLLVQTLESTGILKGLIVSETDSVALAVSRAQSYFLVNAMCCTIITFTIGPKLLTGPGESEDAESNPPGPGDSAATLVSEASEVDETTSLLPASVSDPTTKAADKLRSAANDFYHRLPLFLQSTLSVMYPVMNPPLLGGMLAAVVGLVPALHVAFFNKLQDGGIFNAWLTTSIQNLGDLFAALQILAVGVKLSVCLRKMVRGEESGYMPARSVVSILTVRFVLWPAISIGAIYAIAANSQVLSDDPILWLAMMLMPCGPSAINLTSLMDVIGSDEEEQFGLAKFLTISYALSPLLAFAVAGGLKASEALIEMR